MTDPDVTDLQQLAALARRRAADARGLARHRRASAASALLGRQPSYAEALLDSACWLESAADAEERRAAVLDAHGAAIAAWASAGRRTSGARR